MAITGPISLRRAAVPVRRCLFGAPDHEMVRKDLKRALKNIEEATKEQLKSKWGFDVDAERGVPGSRFEYTEVKSTDYVPEFYRKVYKNRSKKFVNCGKEGGVSVGTQVDDTSVSVFQEADGQRDAHADRLFGVEPFLPIIHCDSKENCANPSTDHNTVRVTTRTRTSLQHTLMTDYFQTRKRRSPDADVLPRKPRKSPRL